MEEDLASRQLTRERAVASVVRLLDLGAVRVGNDSYARRNKSFGATTLHRRHVELTGKTLKLRYKGKGGKDREAVLSDASLAKVVRALEQSLDCHGRPNGCRGRNGRCIPCLKPGRAQRSYCQPRDCLHAVSERDTDQLCTRQAGKSAHGANTTIPR